MPRKPFDLRISSLGEVTIGPDDSYIAEEHWPQFLPQPALATVRKVHEMQEAITDGRFRIYYFDGRAHLCTEFRYDNPGDDWVRTELEEIAITQGCRVDDVGAPYDGQIQVELSRPVTDLVDARIWVARIAEDTQSLWGGFGVSVS